MFSQVLARQSALDFHYRSAVRAINDSGNIVCAKNANRRSLSRKLFLGPAKLISKGLRVCAQAPSYLAVRLTPNLVGRLRILKSMSAKSYG
jgi:hypothetical protein